MIKAEWTNNDALSAEQTTQTNAHNTLNALDCISRQAAIGSIMEGPSEMRYPVFYAEKIRRLPFEQSEQDGKVSFWKERAKEYEDIILRFATEKAKGIKLDSIEITGERIIFKNSQPERKRGRWVDGRCSECGYDWGKDAPIASVPNFCPNCGVDMRGEEDE